MKRSKLTREAHRLIEALEPHAQAVLVHTAYEFLHGPHRRSIRKRQLLSKEQRLDYRNWMRRQNSRDSEAAEATR
jgi:hypothetical protein